jgi:molybdate transport system substrate-binding protein
MLRLIALLCLALWPAMLPAQPMVPVGAAADLRLVLPAFIASQQAATAARFTVSYGSSGQMVQQALNGAPFQLLLLADASHAARLAQARPGARLRPYALGRLALVARTGSGITSLQTLVAAIRSGRLRRLAIANPAHAPYGVAARAVLAGLGVAETTPLALGDNVAQALSFVTSGAAEAGLVALPLARAAAGSILIVPVPPERHAPLVQTLVLLPGADPAAQRLAEALTGPQGRRALATAGFGLPQAAP